VTAGCPTQAKPGSAVYADYFAKQLDREDERKVSLEARGVLVVTTSGVLSTILLGLATLTKKKDAAFALPDSARWWVVAALVLLTLAVAGAIVTISRSSPTRPTSMACGNWSPSPGPILRARLRGRSQSIACPY